MDAPSFEENPLTQFLTDVAYGVDPEQAATAAGFTMDEIRKFAEGSENFKRECAKAAVMAERSAIRCISESVGKQSWMAATWWLERRHPERYAKRDKLDITMAKRNLNIEELREEINALMSDPEVQKALKNQMLPALTHADT